MTASVSIHAPVKGATQRWSWPSRRPGSFNPRTREGCDISALLMHRFPLVSIHAPVKGATSSADTSALSPWCFNPRTREGCDITMRASALMDACFNPRTREGCDGQVSDDRAATRRFQSTHP